MFRGPKNILSYKKTRSGNSSLDKIFMNLNRQNKIKVREFDPTTGSDERQYNCRTKLACRSNI